MRVDKKAMKAFLATTTVVAVVMTLSPSPNGGGAGCCHAFSYVSSPSMIVPPTAAGRFGVGNGNVIGKGGRRMGGVKFHNGPRRYRQLGSTTTQDIGRRNIRPSQPWSSSSLAMAAVADGNVDDVAIDTAVVAAVKGGDGTTTTTLLSSESPSSAAGPPQGEGSSLPPPTDAVGSVVRSPLPPKTTTTSQAQTQSTTISTTTNLSKTERTRLQLEEEIREAESIQAKIVQDIQEAQERRAQLEERATERRQKLQEIEEKQRAEQELRTQLQKSISGGMAGMAVGSVATLGGLVVVRNILQNRSIKLQEEQKRLEEERKRLEEEQRVAGLKQRRKQQQNNILLSALGSAALGAAIATSDGTTMTGLRGTGDAAGSGTGGGSGDGLLTSNTNIAGATRAVSSTMEDGTGSGTSTTVEGEDTVNGPTTNNMKRPVGGGGFMDNVKQLGNKALGAVRKGTINSNKQDEISGRRRRVDIDPNTIEMPYLDKQIEAVKAQLEEEKQLKQNVGIFNRRDAIRRGPQSISSSSSSSAEQDAIEERLQSKLFKEQQKQGLDPTLFLTEEERRQVERDDQEIADLRAQEEQLELEREELLARQKAAQEEEAQLLATQQQQQEEEQQQREVARLKAAEDEERVRLEQKKAEEAARLQRIVDEKEAELRKEAEEARLRAEQEEIGRQKAEQEEMQLRAELEKGEERLRMLEDKVREQAKVEEMERLRAAAEYGDDEDVDETDGSSRTRSLTEMERASSSIGVESSNFISPKSIPTLESIVDKGSRILRNFFGEGDDRTAKVATVGAVFTGAVAAAAASLQKRKDDELVGEKPDSDESENGIQTSSTTDIVTPNDTFFMAKPDAANQNDRRLNPDIQRKKDLRKQDELATFPVNGSPSPTTLAPFSGTVIPPPSSKPIANVTPRDRKNQDAESLKINADDPLQRIQSPLQDSTPTEIDSRPSNPAQATAPGTPLSGTFLPYGPQASAKRESKTAESVFPRSPLTQPPTPSSSKPDSNLKIEQNGVVSAPKNVNQSVPDAAVNGSGRNVAQESSLKSNTADDMYKKLREEQEKGQQQLPIEPPRNTPDATSNQNVKSYSPFRGMSKPAAPPFRGDTPNVPPTRTTPDVKTSPEERVEQSQGTSTRTDGLRNDPKSPFIPSGVSWESSSQTQPKPTPLSSTSIASSANASPSTNEMYKSSLEQKSNTDNSASTSRAIPGAPKTSFSPFGKPPIQTAPVSKVSSSFELPSINSGGRKEDRRGVVKSNITSEVTPKIAFPTSPPLQSSTSTSTSSDGIYSNQMRETETKTLGDQKASMPRETRLGRIGAESPPPSNQSFPAFGVGPIPGESASSDPLKTTLAPNSGSKGDSNSQDDIYAKLKQEQDKKRAQATQQKDSSRSMENGEKSWTGQMTSADSNSDSETKKSFSPFGKPPRKASPFNDSSFAPPATLGATEESTSGQDNMYAKLRNAQNEGNGAVKESNARDKQTAAPYGKVPKPNAPKTFSPYGQVPKPRSVGTFGPTFSTAPSSMSTKESTEKEDMYARLRKEQEEKRSLEPSKGIANSQESSRAPNVPIASIGTRSTPNSSFDTLPTSKLPPSTDYGGMEAKTQNPFQQGAEASKMAEANRRAERKLSRDEEDAAREERARLKTLGEARKRAMEIIGAGTESARTKESAGPDPSKPPDATSKAVPRELPNDATPLQSSELIRNDLMSTPSKDTILQEGADASPQSDTRNQGGWQQETIATSSSTPKVPSVPPPSFTFSARSSSSNVPSRTEKEAGSEKPPVINVGNAGTQAEPKSAKEDQKSFAPFGQRPKVNVPSSNDSLYEPPSSLSSSPSNPSEENANKAQTDQSTSVGAAGAVTSRANINANTVFTPFAASSIAPRNLQPSSGQVSDETFTRPTEPFLPGQLSGVPKTSRAEKVRSRVEEQAKFDGLRQTDGTASDYGLTRSRMDLDQDILLTKTILATDENYIPSTIAVEDRTVIAFLQEVDGTPMHEYQANESLYTGRSVRIFGESSLTVPVRVSTPGSIVEYTIEKKSYDFSFGITTRVGQGQVKVMKKLRPFDEKKRENPAQRGIRKIVTDRLLVGAGSAPSLLTFNFENRNSWTLEMTYQIRVIPPTIETAIAGRRLRAQAGVRFLVSDLQNLETRLAAASGERKLLETEVAELDKALQALNKSLRDAKEKEWSCKLQLDDGDELVR